MSELKICKESHIIAICLKIKRMFKKYSDNTAQINQLKFSSFKIVHQANKNRNKIEKKYFIIFLIIVVNIIFNCINFCI